MKIIKLIIFALCIGTALLIHSSCSKENSNAKKAEVKADIAFKINTATVVGKTVQRTVESTGTLAAWEEVIVSNEMAGTVEKIFADLGDKVTEGQLLLRLDQQDAKANFNSAEAALDTNIRGLERARAVWTDASANLKRYINLFSEGIISISQRDAVQTQYDVADAQLKQAEAQVNQSKAQFEIAKKRLADTEIKAPISGEVKKRYVSAGEALKDKTQLFILVKNNPLKFQGAVPESYAPDIKTGQQVIIYIDAVKDRTFPARVARVSPSVDIPTRTLSIEAEVPNVNNVLKSGFFARAVVITKKEDNIPFIPEGAVYSYAGINKLYVISNGLAKERLVKKGMSEAGMVEIVEGIKPGEIVATTGLDQLFDGAKIQLEIKD